MCLVISYCDLLTLHGNCLWDFLSPVKKMLSSRQNLLFLLPSCLKLMLAYFNLKLGLKFFNYPNYIKFDLKKKKIHKHRFLWLRCVRASFPNTGSAQNQGYFPYSSLKEGVVRMICIFLVDANPKGSYPESNLSFTSRASH